MANLTITKKNLKLLQNASKEFDILVQTIEPFLVKQSLAPLHKIQYILQLSFKEPLLLEDMKKIESLSPEVSKLEGSVGDYMNEFKGFKEQTNNIYNLLSDIFYNYRVKEQEEFNNKIEKFSILKEKHKLWAYWSDYSISFSDLNKSFSNKPVKTISYDGYGQLQTIKVGKIATWFDMWKIADQMMKSSRNQDNQYIERFEEDPKKRGHYKLVTGL